MLAPAGNLRHRPIWQNALAFTLALVAWAAGSAPLAAQQPPSRASGPQKLPEPILWKQSRFLIPYQWSATTDQSQPQTVRLFISKDQGRSWQPISEAEPHLRGFTYHAEQDGEFWFSIRTIDAMGRAWPDEPHQPELRVIVDTTFPEISELGGTLSADGQLEIYWSASDARLEAQSLKIEVQTSNSRTWQTVTLPAQQAAPDGTSRGRATWQLPPGTSKALLRAEVYDQAGNRSFCGGEAVLGASADRDNRQYPTMVFDRSDLPQETDNASGQPAYPQTGLADPFAASAPADSETPAQQGWRSAPSATAGPVGPSRRDSSRRKAPQQAASQPWPAAPPSNPAPSLSADSSEHNSAPGTAGSQSPNHSPYSQAANAKQQPTTTPGQTGPLTPPFGPVEPYRPVSNSTASDRKQNTPQPTRPSRDAGTTGTNRASSRRLPGGGRQGTTSLLGPHTSVPRDTAASPAQSASHENKSWQATGPAAWVAQQGVQLPAGTEPMMVSERTFELEYELEEVGNWGVAQVELWGSRDGGKRWRRYTHDDDNSSPIRVTVEGEGVYGFRIVAKSPGGPAPSPPQPGDQPELWVGVDLQRPQAELVSVEQGTGNQSDHLIFHWRAKDLNLAPRPIALFYSSRPGGPWSAVATGLENTGEYAWRLERHLPAQFYLRLEARDTAGNLATYQTSQPVVLNQARPAVQLRGVRPVRSANDSSAAPLR